MFDFNFQKFLMALDYKLPVDLFRTIADMFLDCQCGVVPVISFQFSSAANEVEISVVCPSCGRSSIHKSNNALDFALLSIYWNSKF